MFFPNVIVKVDQGSKDILVQIVKGSEQILLLKAAKESFPETNLTMITADGKIRTFIINYDAAPISSNLVISNTETLFKRISEQPRTIVGIQNKNSEMLLRLKGLYISNDILYFQLAIHNRSNIGYDIDLLRFYIKDKKQSRRTASQEIEQPPLYIYNNTGTVPGMSSLVMVAAILKFTIPDKKVLYIQVMEKNGGRHLRLKIRNKVIVHTSVYPD